LALAWVLDWVQILAADSVDALEAWAALVGWVVVSGANRLPIKPKRKSA